ncbi:hypothetical protein HMPREF1582_00882, partial [Gardnerella vaginalis JCP8151A]
ATAICATLQTTTTTMSTALLARSAQNALVAGSVAILTHLTRTNRKIKMQAHKRLVI